MSVRYICIPFRHRYTGFFRDLRHNCFCGFIFRWFFPKLYSSHLLYQTDTSHIIGICLCYHHVFRIANPLVEILKNPGCKKMYNASDLEFCPRTVSGNILRKGFSYMSRNHKKKNGGIPHQTERAPFFNLGSSAPHKSPSAEQANEHNQQPAVAESAQKHCQQKQKRAEPEQSEAKQEFGASPCHFQADSQNSEKQHQHQNHCQHSFILLNNFTQRKRLLPQRYAMIKVLLISPDTDISCRTDDFRSGRFLPSGYSLLSEKDNTISLLETQIKSTLKIPILCAGKFNSSRTSALSLSTPPHFHALHCPVSKDALPGMGSLTPH